MDYKKRQRAICGVLAFLYFSAGGAKVAASETLAARLERAQDSDARQAFVHPNPSGPIAERAAWARREAKTKGWDKGFWLGFGIRRLMGEHSWMGWYPWGDWEMHLTLDDLINGRKTPLEKRIANDQAVRGTAASLPGAAHSFAARRIGEEPERSVMREIGILMRTTVADAGFPLDFRVSSLNLPFDFEGLPFVWVGMATDSESLDFLIPLYAKATADEDKLSILWAIGLHRNAASVVPFVERILAGNESDKIRAEAAECLGEQNVPKALDLLVKTIKGNLSEEVREGAVNGLVEMELPSAAEALISFALGSADHHVRREAVRGLAHKATAESVKALEKISASDKNPEIQKIAIHALADLPRPMGLLPLISLVKTHPDVAVRKEAVEAMGDVGGAEAVKVLTELAKGRRF
jgi:hypothetical protein